MTEKMPLIAGVAVSNTSYSFDRLFSYTVPAEMREYAAPGCRVLVPFGRGDSRRIGFIMSVSEGDGKGLKAVREIIDAEPVVSRELIGLAMYLRDNTFCTYFDAVRVMLPPAMSVTLTEKYTLNTDFSDESVLGSDAARVYGQIKELAESGELSDKAMAGILDGKRRIADELCEKGALISDNIFRQSVGDASVASVRLSEEYLSEPEKFSLTPKQKKVADFLAECDCASVRETAYMCGVTPAVVKRLTESGAAVGYSAEILRQVGSFYDPGDKDTPAETVLSPAQQDVKDAVFSKIQKREPAVFLLQGVTGSGKTLVFEKLIADTRAMGRQVLMMIPEIGLTPQILGRFRSVFGEKVAVIHSGLSQGQRLDEYKRIKRGLADIVIGTRSAVFAPLDNIGLIIMDEEGDRSYKSDKSPRYSTCDVAKQRCAFHRAVLLLASATPSIESRYYAEKGLYGFLELRKRYYSDDMPEVDIIDMNTEREEGNRAQFSRRLVREIRENLDRGEQTMLLLNRRGYHTVISCCDCYKPVYCPNCSVPLTYHKKNGKMMCHYCGYVCDLVTVCPECGSHRLRQTGFGTQKLEEELAMFFPDARILRMDADTVFSRYSYEKDFGAFRRGEYDIMVGTQMIGKGLDFPNVTLVGVLSVDRSLYAGDFRSYERTFSLITQVVGRGGRGLRKGRAILQTFMPDHYIMKLAANQDYDGFYREEIAMRRAMIFPPVCDMCVIGLSGQTDRAVWEAAEAVLGLMEVKLREVAPKTPVRVLGPVRCSYAKINGKFRYRIIIKCKNTAQMRGFISDILVSAPGLTQMSGIGIFADMNGDTGV